MLAGGASRRMGRPKATLEFGGTTLLAWMVERLAPAFAETLVSANDDESVAATPAGVRVVADLHVGAGPLAGIEAGLAAAAHDHVFAVAVNIPPMTGELGPTITPAVAGRDAAVPRSEERPEPVCAAYSRSAGPVIAAALGRGERRAAAVLAELDVAWLDDLDPAPFRNLNTPEDYRALLGAIRGDGKFMC